MGKRKQPDIPYCDKCKKEDDIVPCTLGIAGKRGVYDLCAECRQPFQDIMDNLPKKTRGRRSTTRPIPPDQIPTTS